MKIFKYSFYILVTLIVTITSISITSTPIKDYNTSINNKVIAEGIVTIIHGFGTREILYPSGYAIKNPIWVVSPPAKISIIYLRADVILLNNFIDKKVRVEGEYFSAPGRMISEIKSISGYDEINVDTIYCVK